MSEELLDVLASAPGKPYDWADEALAAIAGAGYSVVKTDRFQRVMALALGGADLFVGADGAVQDWQRMMERLQPGDLGPIEERSE